ncbi:hypothetical protein Q428_07915 [Fervidicella metallireducens AeB]|uniref:Cell division protein FtsL n=1 Tax=Fervidicella metallireducens AeB TaxID=1403537 RepID=A0A017RWX3_9CLOT|nr:hypothetical protein [Fervidicella metallireducens]EYE88435.1 hypothetical protein Q428_07915 [Fervidicella metallireducens AeB]
MVMAKNQRSRNTYMYGNVAYDVKPRVKKPTKKRVIITKKKKNSLAKKLKLMSAVGILFIVSFITLCRFATIVNLSNEIRKVRAEVVSLQKDNENIRVEIAKKDNIKQIEMLATKKYGMVAVESENTVFMKVEPLTAVSNTNQKETAFHMIQRVLGLIY